MLNPTRESNSHSKASSMNLMSAQDYCESLKEYTPNVYVRGSKVECVVNHPLLKPGVNAIGMSYDFARMNEHRQYALAKQHTSGNVVNRFVHINRNSDDLLSKLEYVRALCQLTGCAMRYLTMDGMNALYQSSYRVDAELGKEYSGRLIEQMHRIQDNDLTVGVAMTDAKGDRSLRPSEQPNLDSHLRVTKRRPDGIEISGIKAIVTAAPYVHELFVLPGRNMKFEDRDFAVACLVPIDAPGLTIIARPAGRPGEQAAKFSSRFGQSTGACVFENVFVPHDKVFLCGEWEHSEYLTKTYANHHRHTCIGARAGFGDLLIGASTMMIETNGLNLETEPHLKESMVELIKTVESFYACGVSASVYCNTTDAGNAEPDAVFSNIGKLMLADSIYDMHRLANSVSGGLIVTLPHPEDDHNPDTQYKLDTLMSTSTDIPPQRRATVARLLEDLTASHSGAWYSVISIHGGGSPQAMKTEIFRNYPIEEKSELVQRLIERGVHSDAKSKSKQPGQCCDTGCEPPVNSTFPRRERNRKIQN